jgi:hypothetical protein
MPAIISIPFVLFFSNFSQTIITHILGALIPTIIFLSAKRNQLSSQIILFLTLLSGVGTVLWFQSSVGSSWYLGQVTGALCLVTAIYVAQSKRWPFLVGFFIGAAYMSRIHTILALPFFLYLMKDSFYRNNRLLWKNIVLFGFGLAIFVFANAYYNVARFGVVWDKGYLLIPGVLQEPWFAKGILHYSYIPHNLKTLFLSTPRLLPTAPYLEPSWNGLSILFTTPAFLLLLKGKFKDASSRLAIFAVFCIAIFVLMHGSNGFAQFGYRFAIDFYPFLFFLMMRRFQTDPPGKLAWTLLFMGILVDAWGVIWINKFDWVGF